VALVPQTFIEDLRTRADIVQVVQEHVSLKKAGATYKGLCPFHGEKTPSFHVNQEKGFFHCFGCGVGGDVIKFVELHERVGFMDAVRLLAQKFGLTVPEGSADANEADARERETLLKIHEVAATFFQEQLATPAGARARDQIARRDLTPTTVEALGLGYAPAARETLKNALVAQGYPLPLLIKSGLVAMRDNGQAVDRFRNRLMIPIARDTGSLVAFGGRALDADQLPKYLNSPETPIYTKGRTLYGLNLTKPWLRQKGYAVLVEGYFDFAQVYQECQWPVVAACGTALTTQQAQLLHRFVSKIALSYDPDAAGQGAAAKSGDLLITEGFQVQVALLPPGDDPDGFIRKHGAARYKAVATQAKPYLEYLLDRSLAAHDMKKEGERRVFLQEMLTVAAKIPDAAARDQFADTIAHRAKITESVVRAEIRKAAVERRTEIDVRRAPTFGRAKPAERGLIWAIMNHPDEAAEALFELEPADTEGVATARILDAALALLAGGGEFSPSALLARLNEEDMQLATALATDEVLVKEGENLARNCVLELQRLRLEREHMALQQEIDRIQNSGDGDIVQLAQQKIRALQSSAKSNASKTR
jgi:DNA primase